MVGNRGSFFLEKYDKGKKTVNAEYSYEKCNAGYEKKYLFGKQFTEK
jgi:hypothetical protein